MRTVKIEDVGQYQCWRDRQPCSAKCMAFVTDEKVERDNVNLPPDVAARANAVALAMKDEDADKAVAELSSIIGPWANSMLQERGEGWVFNYGDEEIKLTAEAVMENVEADEDDTDPAGCVSIDIRRIAPQTEGRCGAHPRY